MPGEAYSVNAEQYPLTFFSIRLMELLSEPSTTLDLHRMATRIRDWFAANSNGLKGFVQTEQGPGSELGATTEPSPTLETGPTRDERQQFATDAIDLVLSQLGFGICLRKGPIELSCLAGSVDGGGGNDGQGQIRGAAGTGTTGRAAATDPGWQKLSPSDR